MKLAALLVVPMMMMSVTACGASSEEDSNKPVSAPRSAPTNEASVPEDAATQTKPTGYDNFAAIVGPVNDAVDTMDELLRDPSITMEALRPACEAADTATSDAWVAIQGNWVADDELVGDPYDAVNAISGYAAVLSNKSRVYAECASAQTVEQAREALSHVSTDLSAAEDRVRFVL